MEMLGYNLNDFNELYKIRAEKEELEKQLSEYKDEVL